MFKKIFLHRYNIYYAHLFWAAVGGHLWQEGHGAEVAGDLRVWAARMVDTRCPGPRHARGRGLAAGVHPGPRNLRVAHAGGPPRPRTRHVLARVQRVPGVARLVIYPEPEQIFLVPRKYFPGLPELDELVREELGGAGCRVCGGVPGGHEVKRHRDEVPRPGPAAAACLPGPGPAANIEL